MRIISEFKDYYDSAVSYNGGIIWNRKNYKTVLDITKKNEWLTHNQIKFLLTGWENRPVLNGNNDSLLLGICGEILPIILLKDIPKNERNYVTYLCSTKNSYKLPNVSAHNNYSDYLVKLAKLYPYTAVKNKNSWRTITLNSIFGRPNIKEPSTITNWTSGYLNKKDVSSIFVGISTPIFIIEYYDHKVQLNINPNLKDYGMQNLYNPWSIYQKLEQYLSNELVDLKFPPFSMSDELKRDAHGFDIKSFKNEKGHKRGKS